MRAKSLEKLVWALIYGGLLLASFGVFVWRRGSDFGIAVTAVGGAATVVGVVLIWVRSRRPP